jgi:zinc transport system substrate-binding protein
LAAGCGAAGGTVTKGAPVLTVATGLWPLAQAAQSIGQGNVRVLDVVPAGRDPRTYALSPTEVEMVRRAGLVVEMGGSFQPSLARAAAGRRARTLTIAPDGAGGNPYVWLDPHAMEKASRQVEAAMAAADPRARRTFATGLYDFEATLQALDADYQSTLSSCTADKVVAVDDAFGVLHPRYPVDVVPLDGTTPAPVAPDATTLRREVATVRAAGVGAVYNETWHPLSALIPLQSRTGVKIGTLDTLEGVPPGGFPQAQASYYDMMESDLGALSSALRCPNPNVGD